MRQADEQVSGPPQIITINQQINPPSGVFIWSQGVSFKWCGTNGAVPRCNDASQHLRPFSERFTMLALLRQKENFNGEKKAVERECVSGNALQKGAKSVGGRGGK